MSCRRPNCRRTGFPNRRGLCYAHFDEVRNREVADRGWHPASEVAERIEWLASRGVKRSDIVRATGISEKALTAIAAGVRERVRAENARRILAIDPDAVIPHDGAYVSAVGPVRRLQSLHAIGYTTIEMAAELGTHKSGLRRLLNGGEKHVRHAYARDIDAMFQRFQLHPKAPVGHALRAINRAKSQGWAPPLAWDEDTIDDPMAQPGGDIKRTIRFPEKYTEMTELGMTEWEIAGRLGVQFEGLKRQLERYDLPVSGTLGRLVNEERNAREAA